MNNLPCHLSLVAALLLGAPLAGAASPAVAATPAISASAAETAKGVTPPVLDLEDCIAYAMEHSPELLKLDIDHARQRLQTTIEKAEFDLALSASSSYETSDDGNERDNSLTLSKELPAGIEVSSSLSTSTDSDDDDDSASWSVTLSKKLLGGGTLLESQIGIKRSLINETIALNSLNQKKRYIIYNVKQQFYQIIRNSQSLSVQKRRLERSRRNLENALEREKPLDIVTARIQIPDNELSVLAAERAIATELDQLKVLIGMPVSQPLKIVETFAFKPADYDLERDLTYAVEHSEDFLNNRLERQKLAWEATIARSQLWPDLTLSASHTQDSEDDSFNLTGDDSQSVSLSLSWQIGRRADKARYSRANFSIRRQDADYYILTQTKHSRLQELDRQLRENAQSIAIQEQRIELVTWQVELYADRWENGEIDILEFVRSQNDLENNKVDLINLKATYMSLLAEYIYQIGQ
jgi:outer membrane protein